MMMSCDEHGVRCEKISCCRSCDIVLLPTINEAPCKKKQRREWYDDLREEYLDHLNPRNVLRTEALFKILFFGKVHEVFIEYGKDNVFELLNNDESSNLVDEMYEVREVLLAIGGQDYSNYYNLMIYYLNNAKGKGVVDYEYVSTSDLSAKHTHYENFSLVYGDFISELITEIYEDNEVEVDDLWYSIPPYPDEQILSTPTLLSNASFQIDLSDEVSNVIDYALRGIDSEDRSLLLALLGEGLEKEAVLSPLKEESVDSYPEPVPQQDKYLSEPLCTMIKKWLDDRREYFIAWREENPTLIRQEPFLLQGYLVGKMIDLVVPKVYGETNGTYSFSFETLSFPKIDDTEKRDRVSAYLLSLLSDEERTNLLYRLDELEGKLLLNTALDIKQLGFDFNNLMEYFLNYYHENVTRQEARQILEFYQKVLVAVYDEGGDLGSDMTRIYIDMCAQLDDDDERSLVKNGMTKVKGILSPLGADEEEYHNWYNVMAYYENIAKGTELEYVSKSVLASNLDMLERFLPYDYDADESSNSTNDYNEYFSIWPEIETALASKPHPDLDDSWTWPDLSVPILIDICDRVRHDYGLEWVIDKAALSHIHLLQAAKECYLIRILQSVLPHQYDDWKEMNNRRGALDYMISNVHITDDERGFQTFTSVMLQVPKTKETEMPKPKERKQYNYPRTATNKLYPEDQGDAKVKFFETVAFTVLGIIALTFLVLCLAAYYLPRPIKRRKISIKPKNAKKKEKESIYSHLLSFVHHGRAMVLGISSKLCGIIRNFPSLLSVLILVVFDSVDDALRSIAIVSFGFIQYLFNSMCSILRRGFQCLVVIPRMISLGIGMLISLPSKLIQEVIGTDVSIDVDKPSNSSPQLREAPQLVMSPSSVVSVVAMDEQKINSIEQNTAVHNNLDEESAPATAIQQEDNVPSEIGIVNSSQVLTYETITEASTSSLNNKSNISTFELNENDPLLIFLRSQHQCIKGSVDEFYTWLVKYENIESMMALKEAVSDDDYLNDTMRIGDKSYGVKGFKLKSFRCAILEHEDTKPVQLESKNVTMNPPEELVCPISLALMTNDPVVAADGITYERASIEDWFKKSKVKISKAQANLKSSPHSESDQRVVDNGVCSPVYGSRMESLTMMPNTVVRNMARAYEEKKEEVH